MDKIRKIKGGMSMFVTEDETLLVNSNCRNTVLAQRRTVREFDYDFIDGFTMVDDDTTFIISTWDGSYIGNI